MWSVLDIKDVTGDIGEVETTACTANTGRRHTRQRRLSLRPIYLRHFNNPPGDDSGYCNDRSTSHQQSTRTRLQLLQRQIYVTSTIPQDTTAGIATTDLRHINNPPGHDYGYCNDISTSHQQSTRTRLGVLQRQIYVTSTIHQDTTTGIATTYLRHINNPPGHDCGYCNDRSMSHQQSTRTRLRLLQRQLRLRFKDAFKSFPS
ncbi:hypothetical protein LSAT2_016743 [Lamellibrachia satsuma]|nr:hypothetical protein LSAT2_016743 [Lamellibrachia satsuma]